MPSAQSNVNTPKSRIESARPGASLPSPGPEAWFGPPLWREIRAQSERRQLMNSPMWSGLGLPPGNGRPVLVIPGFLSSARKADPIKRVLELSGWDVKVASLGRNAGPAYRILDAALDCAAELKAQTGQRVSVVGHSRGGQLARILGVLRPDLVHRVIAAGAPLREKYPAMILVKAPAEALEWGWRAGLFGEVSEQRELLTDVARDAPLPPGVELVSIFSRTDGIVDWRYSATTDAELIEIDCSHLGLISSPAGVRTIVEVLDRAIE